MPLCRRAVQVIIDIFSEPCAPKGLRLRAGLKALKALLPLPSACSMSQPPFWGAPALRAQYGIIWIVEGSSPFFLLDIRGGLRRVLC